MRQLERFPTWFSKFFLGALGVTIAVFFLLGHLLTIPLDRLIRAWLVCLAAFAVWGTLMYFALWYRIKSGGDTRLVFAAAALIGVSGSCLAYYWGFRLGLVSGGTCRGLCVTITIALPPITTLLYYLERKWHILR